MNDTPETTDINELMHRDPLEHSDKDIESIIEYYRGARYRFNQGDMKAGSTKPKAKPKALQGVDMAALGKLEIKL